MTYLAAQSTRARRQRRSLHVAVDDLVFGPAVIVRFKRSRNSLHQRLATGRRWRHLKPGAGLKRCVGAVQSGWDSTIKHSVWVAARAAFRDASSRSRALRQRRRRRSPERRLDTARATASRSDTGFGPGERGTLEVGSGVVLGALGLGLQLGRWPAWTALVAVGGYLTWVVIYSEATVQTRRWRSGERRLARLLTSSAKAAPAPAHE